MDGFIHYIFSITPGIDAPFALWFRQDSVRRMSFYHQLAVKPEVCGRELGEIVQVCFQHHGVGLTKANVVEAVMVAPETKHLFWFILLVPRDDLDGRFDGIECQELVDPRLCGRW